MQDSFDILNNIKQVNPSEMLFNRIQRKIEAEINNSIALPKVYAIATSFALLIVINFIGISKIKSEIKCQNVIVINTLNNFYNE
jgi:hypothetical protein